MSRTIYESLFDADGASAPEDDLVRAFAQAGRLHQAAHDLATDEMLEGIYVESLPDESEVRLAADDRSEVARTLTAGPYVVQVEWSPGGVCTATQSAGPSGATLVIDGQFIPLEIDTGVDLPLQAVPDSLKLMDLQGKTHTLR